MNTNQINSRKATLIQSVKNGKPFRLTVAPGEFLALVAHTDPLNFNRGFEMLREQTKVDDDAFYDYMVENECSEEKLEMVRNSLYMDPVRAQINRFKYENGLIPDDEITEENIIAPALDKRVAQVVAEAVIKTARETGVARK